MKREESPEKFLGLFDTGVYFVGDKNIYKYKITEVHGGFGRPKKEGTGTRHVLEQGKNCMMRFTMVKLGAGGGTVYKRFPVEFNEKGVPSFCPTSPTWFTAENRVDALIWISESTGSRFSNVKETKDFKQQISDAKQKYPEYFL